MVAQCFNLLLWSLSLFGGSMALAVINALPHPWFRLSGEAYNLKMSDYERFLAFTDREGFNLSYLDLKTKKVFLVSNMQVGNSFFFSPDGHRIFYRELLKAANEPVVTVVKAFDTGSKVTQEISRINGSSGPLTFDPRDLRFQLIHPGGILSKVIVFPDERLAKWQLAQRTEQGKWLASVKGILWLTHSGFTMNLLEDDHSGLQSFDISPDGTHCVWSTINGGVYVSQLGNTPKFLTNGYDPKWHPSKNIIVLAGGRMTGKKIVSTDIKVVGMDGNEKWLTNDTSTDKRFPAWTDLGRGVLFSMKDTTDIYQLEISHD